MAIDYVTWKIVPKLDYLNFASLVCIFFLMVGPRLSAPAQQFKIITEV